MPTQHISSAELSDDFTRKLMLRIRSTPKAQNKARINSADCHEEIDDPSEQDYGFVCDVCDEDDIFNKVRSFVDTLRSDQMLLDLFLVLGLKSAPICFALQSYKDPRYDELSAPAADKESRQSPPEWIARVLACRVCYELFTGMLLLELNRAELLPRFSKKVNEEMDSTTDDTARSGDPPLFSSKRFLPGYVKRDDPAFEIHAKFAPRSTFSKRISVRAESKRMAAKYVVRNFCTEGASMFVTDGSSTFYVCIAIAEQARKLSNGTELMTNNVPIIAELAAMAEMPTLLDLRLLGGTHSEVLQATFPYEDKWEDTLKGIPLVITSARFLTLAEGPVGPEAPSRALKYAALRAAADIVFVVDWEKLCPPVEYHYRVFSRITEWFELLYNKSVWIVCDKPRYIGPNEEHQITTPDGLVSIRDAPIDTYKHGQELFWRLMHEPGMLMTQLDRYCLEAYRFATLTDDKGKDIRVRFVEVEWER